MTLVLAPSISMQALTTSARSKITVCTKFPVKIMQARQIFLLKLSPIAILTAIYCHFDAQQPEFMPPRSQSAQSQQKSEGTYTFPAPLFRPSTQTSCPSECLINCNHFSFVYFTCVVRLVCVSFAPARSPSVFVCCCCFIINPRPKERNKF